jgi:o-succinylbenzoate synthase
MSYRFSFKPYRRQFRIPLKTGHGVWTEREGVILRLETEGGAIGFGEVAPLPWFGTESFDDALAICRTFSAQLNDRQIDAVPARFGCVRFALHSARAALLPLKQDGARLPVAALLPAGRAALDVLPDRLAAGFLACKWKVGVGRPEEELGIFDDLLANLPNYVRLRLDANGAWDRRQAERWLERCVDRPVEFVEQPLPPDDDDGLLGLAHDYPVTLALDESVSHLQSARSWRGRGWNGVFVLKPSLTGPLEETLVWIREAKADIVISSAMETAVGRMAILRWALAEKPTTRALGFGVGEIFGDRRWDGPVTGPLLDAGWIAAVDAEGLWNALN